MTCSDNIDDIQVVRYGELEPCFDAFIDTRTPGSDKKENFTIIGPGVSENPNQHVHIMEPHGFNIGGARQPPGCVNSQHSHDTAEFFYVHSGTWSFNIGEKGENAEVSLKPGDAISIPTQLFRGFENIGDNIGFLWAVLGGDDPGRVLWAPHVFNMAEEYGLTLLENGSLIDTGNGERIPDGVRPMPVTSRQQVEQLQILDDSALNKCCVFSGDDIPSEAGSGWINRRIVHPSGQLSWPHEFAVEELRIEPNATVDLGSTQNNQVLFIHSGSASLTANSSRADLSEGDTATVRCNLPRTVYNESTQDAVVLVVTGVNGKTV